MNSGESCSRKIYEYLVYIYRKSYVDIFIENIILDDDMMQSKQQAII